jgi:hypothetical protein
MLRVAAAGAGIAWLLLVAAFGIAATTVSPDLASVLAVLALLAIAAAGFLYAWREPGA